MTNWQGCRHVHADGLYAGIQQHISTCDEGSTLVQLDVIDSIFNHCSRLAHLVACFVYVRETSHSCNPASRADKSRTIE